MASRLFILLLSAVLGTASSAISLLPTTAPTFSPTLSPMEFPVIVGATMKPFPNAPTDIAGNVNMGWSGDTLSLTGSVSGLTCTKCFVAVTTEVLCGFDFIGGFPSFYFTGPVNPWVNASFNPDDGIDVSLTFEYPWTVYGRTVIIYENNQSSNTGLACGKLLFPESETVPQSTLLNGRPMIAYGEGESDVVPMPTGNGSVQLRVTLDETFSGELNATYAIQFFAPVSSPPTMSPTPVNDTDSPTETPTFQPTGSPTTEMDTERPTFSPTFSPTLSPTLPEFPPFGSLKIIPGTCGNIANTDEAIASVDWILDIVTFGNAIADGKQETNLTADEVNEYIFRGGLSTFLFERGGRCAMLVKNAKS